jgi:hypothetical protein
MNSQRCVSSEMVPYHTIWHTCHGATLATHLSENSMGVILASQQRLYARAKPNQTRISVHKGVRLI